MATFTPAPRAMSEPELAALECDLRSGVVPDLTLARRLVATVRDRETALRWAVCRRQVDEAIIPIAAREV